MATDYNVWVSMDVTDQQVEKDLMHTCHLNILYNSQWYLGEALPSGFRVATLNSYYVYVLWEAYMSHFQRSLMVVTPFSAISSDLPPHFILPTQLFPFENILKLEMKYV